MGTLRSAPRARVAGLRIALPRTAAPAALAALAGATALAALLRFSQFGNVHPNPFYDAAVRSMAQSWHNFFFGAFDPSGSLSVDKPPVDLWLQVVSVKLFGFSSTSLRLPEALAGTLAVPLLYDTVRRLCGRAAGIAAAAALAVLPVAVLTARSDTMDSMLMALMVLAAWLVVVAAERRRTWLLLAAGVVLGIAFNVKLFEAFLPLPALALLYLIASDGSVWRRMARLVVAGAVTVAVSLSWILAVSASSGPKPFPIGSTNGSVWNVVFVFNGSDRLAAHAATAAAAPVDGTHKAVSTVGPLRLFQGGAHGNGRLVGAVLAAALALGAIALLVGLARARRSGEATPEASTARRRGRAAVAAFATWMLLGTVLFSQVERLHTRYLEAFTAAIAATLGIALASLATAAPRSRLAAGALAIGVAAASTLSLRLSGTSGSIATVATVAAAAVAIGCAVLTLPGLERLRRPGAAGVLIALALVAVLLGPADYARGLVQAGSSDSGRPGSMPPRRLDKIANYLATHSAGTRYELASASAVTAGPLIVRDGRPVLVLTSLNGLPFASQQQVQTAVETGQVRYAMLPRGHCTPRFAGKARCAPGVLWARAHGTDVSPAAGLRRGTLYSLSPQPVPAR